MAAMRKAMTTNIKLGKYEMQHNTNSEGFIEELIEILEEAKHVSQIGMSHRSEELQELFNVALAKNKPAKGKKGKKKKK